MAAQVFAPPSDVLDAAQNRIDRRVTRLQFVIRDQALSPA